VEYIKKVSLGDYKYIRSNNFVDLIPLFGEDHQSIFDSADKILIEAQPPGGFTNIEILLHYMFKEKRYLSPSLKNISMGTFHMKESTTLQMPYA